MTPLEELRPLADVPLDVEARLECCLMSVEHLLALQAGGVIRTERAAGDNVEVVVSGQIIGTGEIIVLGNSLGFRITDFREKF
jgi:flagellar motor switch protein FliN